MSDTTREVSLEQVPTRKNGGGIAFAQGASIRVDGRITATKELTVMQSAFARAMAENGGNQTLAAEMAGYADPSNDGWRLYRQPHVKAAVEEHNERALKADALFARHKMRWLMENSQKDQVVFMACKWVLEAAGLGLAARAVAAGIAPNDKPLSDMTLGELDKLIAESESRLKAIKVVSTVQDSTASNAPEMSDSVQSGNSLAE